MSPKEKMNRIFKKALVERILEKERLEHRDFEKTHNLPENYCVPFDPEYLYSKSRKELECILNPTLYLPNFGRAVGKDDFYFQQFISNPKTFLISKPSPKPKK